MTQREKINELKNTITFLYSKEGRSLNYISKLLELNRKTLTEMVRSWQLEQAMSHKYLIPSNQKFADKNKQLIKSRLDNDVPITDIARELSVTAGYLSNIIEKTDCLKRAKDDCLNRLKTTAALRKQSVLDNSRLTYDFADLPNEEWKEILGYPGYFVSNQGRIKAYKKKYNTYNLLHPQVNSRNGRLYVRFGEKGLQVARLVGFAFVDGYSAENNTIEHKDNDITNNAASNLRWVSQSENNRLAYQKGRSIVKAHSKLGKFKKIVLDGKYEFKTITALAKFLDISTRQLYRYLDKECKCDHKFKIIY